MAINVTSVVPVDGTVHGDKSVHVETAPESAPVHPDSTDDVVTVSTNYKTLEINETRLKANVAISSANLVAETADKVDSIFKSLSGIVEQAKGQTPEAAVKLEDEGKKLIDEVDSLIRKISTNADPAETAVRAEVERSVGKALHLITLNKQKAFGLDKLELTNREAILITQSTIAKAKARFDEFKATAGRAAQSARAASISADVAAAQRNPAVTAIRQADEAIRTTGKTRDAIADDPVTAINSIGESSGASINL